MKQYYFTRVYEYYAYLNNGIRSSEFNNKFENSICAITRSNIPEIRSINLDNKINLYGIKNSVMNSE
jgi:hypothetical protein